jgi:hypothetical protein
VKSEHAVGGSILPELEEKAPSSLGVHAFWVVTRQLRRRLYTAMIPTAVLAVLSAMSAPADAQWFDVHTPNVPRLPDGKVNVNAPAPHTKDGKLDLSGIWEPNGLKYLLNIAADLKPSDIPMQPWAKQLVEERRANFGKDDPDSRCLPSGIPRKDAITSPYKIIQLPDEIVFLYESRTIFRQVFTDGRSLPKDPQPTWYGYSVGHWEGDTLVVESTGFNGKAWLDSAGHPITDALHLTEKFRRPDFGHMFIEITIDDPKAYTKPWTVTENPHYLADTELIEYICNENNRDVQHLVGK